MSDQNPRQVQCSVCEGDGRVAVGAHYVTHEMAIDAGDRSLEGQFHSVEYAPCGDCGGTGLVEGAALPPVESSPLDLEALDPGIRDTVALLRSAGFATTDSGDGVSKPADERTFHVPHVAATCERTVMLREAEIMATVLGCDWRVEASYCPNDKSVVLLATRGEIPKRVCRNCGNLRTFELADDILTCPVLNIRLHETTVETFGCSLWEPWEPK